MTDYVQHGKEKLGKPYHYTECGLEDVYLLNGYTERKTPYGIGVSVDNIDDLHNVIALHICCDKPIMNGKEFKFLRKLMDMTQAETSVLLGCDPQTVARWEKGEINLKSTADKLIRLLAIGFIRGDINPLEIVQHVSNIDERTSNNMMFKESGGQWKSAKAA